MWTHMFLLSLLFFLQTYAIQENEIGKQDTYIQNLGIPKSAQFHMHPQKRRVYLASNDNVLGSLNLKSSKIVWRHILPEEGNLDSIHQSDYGLAALVNNGKRLYYFNLDGSLNWDVKTSSHDNIWKDVMALSEDVDGDSIADVAVLANSSVQVLSGRDGSEIFVYSNKDLVLHKLHISGSVLYVLATSTGSSSSTVSTVSINLKQKLSANINKLDNNYRIAIPLTEQGLPQLVLGHLVAITNNEDQLIINKLGSKNVETISLSTLLSNTQLRKIFPNNKAILESLEVVLEDTNNEKTLSAFLVMKNSEKEKERALFSLRYTDGKQIKNDDIQLIKILDPSEAISSVSVVSSQSHLAIVSGRNLTIYNLQSQGDSALQYNLPVWDDRNNHDGEQWQLEKIWLSSIVKDKKSAIHHLLALGKDGAVRMISASPSSTDAVDLWKREEALSHVTQTEFVELPVDRSRLHRLTEEFSLGIVSRLISHMKLLVELLLDLPSNVTEILNYVSNWKSQNKDTDDGSLTRDLFGYRKIIISTTKTGKIFGLHSTTGQIVWTRFIPNVEFHKLYIVKNPLDNPSECAIIMKEKSKWQLLIINSLNGNTIEKKELPFTLKYVESLPFTDSNHHTILLFLDLNRDIHLYPNTDEAKSIVQKNADKIHFFIQEDSTITGYKIFSSFPDTPLNTKVIWKKMFSGESIESILSEGRNMNAYLPAQPLGDESVLWKYLDPNLLIVATTSVDSGSSDDLDESDSSQSPDDYTMTVYIIDIVTGEIIHRTKHRYGAGPVHLAYAENWISYHFWNAKTHTFEFASTYLFEKNPNQEETFSSLTALEKTELQVIQQSFVFPASVRTLAVTKTSQGITNKQVLVGLSSGSIMALDKRWIDPRRPIRNPPQPTPEDQKEGIFPYFPVLEISPQHFINYNRSVERLRSIHTSATSLESTTLVMCHGLDLFYISIAPSKTFDRLDPGFNRIAVVIAMLGLFTAVLVTRYFSERSLLKVQWK